MGYRFSVIVPIYNSEKTLKRCIGSLLYQNYPDIQIVLVNDGSHDASGRICQRYADHYSFIKYINQDNQGVSSARNRGIESAEGEWILFVDSDDYVTRNYFAVIDDQLNRYPCDLLVFANYFQKDDRLIRKKQRSYYSDDLQSTRIKISEMICNKTLNSPWGKVYRRSIIQKHHVDFTEGVSIAEDRAFNIKYALYISSICTIPDRLYCTSLDNDNSLSRRKDRDDNDHFAKAAADINQEIIKSGLSESERRIFYQAIRFGEYRSIYRTAKELNRDGIRRRDRISRLKRECRRWNENGLDYPDLLYCHLLMLPISLKMVFFLDFMGWALTR